MSREEQDTAGVPRGFHDTEGVAGNARSSVRGDLKPSDAERYERLRTHLLNDHNYGEDYFALVETQEPLTLGNLRWLHEPHSGHGCPTTRQIEEGGADK